MEIVLILLFVAFLVFKFVIRNPNHRGKMGENRVASILRKLPNEYRTLNNIIIPARNSTAQIDHIVVSPYGIFVIETKNYTGWIFGSDKSEQWKETFKTTEGCYFRNPVKQNWGHVYALSEYLNLNRQIFKPVVVFSDHATLHVESSMPVLYMSRLKRYIMSFEQEIISHSDATLIFNRLCEANLTENDKEAERRHVQSVRDNIAKQETAWQSGKCPRCGGDLILRKGKYGAFYGCSNYPKCRFTHNTQ